MVQCPSCGEQVSAGNCFCAACGHRLPLPEQKERSTEFEFSEFIEERAESFTGREWLFRTIAGWLDDPQAPSLFMLTGGPGTGKSAIAARLAQFSSGLASPPAGAERLKPQFLSALHFCMAGESSTIEPLKFVRSLAQQLCRIEGFALGLVKDTDLQASVVQNFQANYNQVIGILIKHIETLVINADNAATALVHTVLDPLKSLSESGEPIVLLVDSLDEALQHRGGETIVRLLARAGALPRRVRLLLTSRPDQAVLLSAFEAVPAHIEPLEAAATDNDRDVRAYIRGRLCDVDELRTQIADAHLSTETVIDQLARASKGNFLYVFQLLRALSAGGIALDNLEDLPPGLDGIYRKMLEQRTLGEDLRHGVWRHYRPLLGTLAVAREALSRDHLARFSSLDLQTVGDFLFDASQFLDPVTSRQDAYRLYHQSLADFLGDRSRAGDGLWIDFASAHQLIADHYPLATLDLWDEYGLRYAALHQAEAIVHWNPDDVARRHVLTEQLVNLVCNPEFQKRRVDDSPGMQHDIAMALKAAARDPVVQSLPLVVRAAFELVRFRQQNRDPKPLFELARKGRLEQAERRLGLFSVDADWRQAILLSLAWLAANQNKEGARTVLDSVAGALPPHPTLDRLLQRVRADVVEPRAAMPALPPLPKGVMPEEVGAVVQRLGGREVVQTVVVRASWEPDRAELLASRDGEVLVAYAAEHLGKPNADLSLGQYVRLHSTYVYDYYRNRSLWALLGWVTCHPDQDWVRRWVAELGQTALLSQAPQFRHAFGLTLITLRARAGKADSRIKLDAVRQQTVSAASEAEAAEALFLQGSGLATDKLDTWGGIRRRLATLAELDAIILGQPDRALIERALRPLGAFAGFRVPALFAVADAAQAISPKADLIDQALEQALAAAHNVQDSRFCAVSTSRVHAMTRRWWPGPQCWKETVERFVSDPAAAAFSALHVVAEGFEGRELGPDKLPLDPLLYSARALGEIAEAYQQPVEIVRELNPNWDVDQTLSDGTEINLSDPAFAPLLASRFAAGVLADATLDQHARAALIQGLVPIAVDDPTALDAVLSRLVCAAQPDDPAMLDTLFALAESIPHAEQAGHVRVIAL